MSRPNTTERIKLGISSCLLGEKVRYDGGHQYNDWINAVLSQTFDFIAVCPEMGIGMGAPRDPIHLRRENNVIRVLAIDDHNKDYTAALSGYGQQTAQKLVDIRGYIFKSKSPSCGLAGVKVYSQGARYSRSGTGIYARAVQDQNPALPCIDETQLTDPVLREQFLEQVMAWNAWQTLCESGLTQHRLREFHSSSYDQLLRHNRSRTRRLDDFVMQVQRIDAKVRDHYAAEFMTILRRPVSK